MHSCQLINLLTLLPGPRLWTVTPPPSAPVLTSSNSSEAGAKFVYVHVMCGLGSFCILVLFNRSRDI